MYKKVLQTYVFEELFVSTIYRKCTADTDVPIWYYETLVFEIDKATKKLCHILESFDSGSDVETAFISHCEICRKYIDKEA